MGLRLAVWTLGMFLANPAFAGSAFDEDVVQFAPVAPVRGGETTTVHLLALDADGAPRLGLSALAIGGGGKAGQLTE